MRILVLTAFDGSRLSEIGLSEYYKEMWQAAEKSAKAGELPATEWERIEISLLKETDIRNIMPAIERADAIIFLTYTRPPINLHTFLEAVGAHAEKPYRLPGVILGFVFIDTEKRDPKDLYYFNALFVLAKRRMKMDLSPGMVRVPKAMSRIHKQFVLNLVEMLSKKEIASKMLEQS